MDYGWLFFKFDGRINRAKLWYAGIIVAGSAFAAALLLFALIALTGQKGPGALRFDVNDAFRIIDPASYRAAIDAIGKTDTVSAGLQILFRAVASSIAVWCFAATAIKRLHDRNKSGWWAIPFFIVPGIFFQFEDRMDDSYLVLAFGLVAAVLYLWAFVEIAFLKGTSGPNRFGHDPLTTQDR